MAKWSDDVGDGFIQTRLHPGKIWKNRNIRIGCGRLVVNTDGIQIYTQHNNHRTNAAEQCARREAIGISPELSTKNQSADGVCAFSSERHTPLDFFAQTYQIVQSISNSFLSQSHLTRARFCFTHANVCSGTWTRLSVCVFIGMKSIKWRLAATLKSARNSGSLAVFCCSYEITCARIPFLFSLTKVVAAMSWNRIRAWTAIWTYRSACRS